MKIVLAHTREFKPAVLWLLGIALLAMVILPSVQLSTWTQIHNAILFTDTPTMLEEQCTFANWDATFDDNC